jgi:uncharacterized peroxidase-related enzyme
LVTASSRGVKAARITACNYLKRKAKRAPRGRIAGFENIVVSGRRQETATGAIRDMGKASKSLKRAGKAASAKPAKGKPALRAIKGGRNGAAKAPVKSAPRPAAAKPLVLKPSPAVADDVPVIALNLEPVKLSPAMSAYFKKCQDKLGFVPNVLVAYAFDMAKLETFVAMYNDLMLGESGLSKLEREMIAVVVSSQNRCYYCLTAHGAAVRQYSGNPLLGEQLVMNYRVARLNKRQRAMLDFTVKLTAQPASVEGGDRERLRRAGFSDRDIWDIAGVVGFFNMSNRVASATDMRPNAVYHEQAR